MKKNIAITGILSCVLYFAAVLSFLTTQSELALTLWEVFTIAGAPVLLVVLLALADFMKTAPLYRSACLAFLACTCALTGLAHILNLTVTRPLIAAGVDVPSFFRIGVWPSVEMAADYLAWGFFMGLAFLCAGVGIRGASKQKRSIKITVLACGALCLTGFFGAVLLHEAVWYLAPLGYGGGTVVLCVQMLRFKQAD